MSAARVRLLLLLAAVAVALAIVFPTIVLFKPWTFGVGPRVLSSLWPSLLFVAASLAFGAFLVSNLSVRGLQHDAFWSLSFASGALAFTLAVGWLAWAQWLTNISLILPILFLAVGARASLARLQAVPPSFQLSGNTLLLMFGGVGVCLLFFQIFSPDGINYDAGWYHLRAAERYAMAGGFMRTPEGDQLLALPLLSSWLYTWGFLQPLAFEEKIRTCMMMELAVVLGTFALIPAMVRRFVPSLTVSETQTSWVAFLLFPSLFIYDTGIMCGGDHIVAFWAVASFLVWFDARQSTRVSQWVLLGFLLTGLLAKYTSLFFLAAFVPVMGIDTVMRHLKTGRALKPLLWAAAVTLTLSMPYWLRNLVWYHNPAYPLLSSVFKSDPWTSDVAAQLLNFQDSPWSNEGSWQHRLVETVKALFNYQTKPYTWGDFVSDQPIFGFSYFVSLCAVPFLQNERRRLLLFAFITHVGIMIWFNTHQHHMRYLSVLMPLMAASAAATACAAQRRWPVVAKAVVALVITLHLVLYADVPFRKTHRMAGGESTVGLGANYLLNKGPPSGRLALFQPFSVLAPNAKVLLHGIIPPLGLPRQSVTDIIGLQFGISYSLNRTLNGVLSEVRKMGVSHLLWTSAVEQTDSIAGEALFQGLAAQTTERVSFNGFTAGELPLVAKEFSKPLLYVGCAQNPLMQTGLYRLEDLSKPAPPREYPWPQPALQKMLNEGADWKSLVPEASVVVVETECGLTLEDAAFTHSAEQVGLPRRLRYYVRAIE